ncbi:hypothetical protein [Sinorhizobium meliloti]|uniref:hypothetical protein n=1 Tax=Rhizobium meliloti TaxID=382 RepID=UPI003D648624
MLSDGGGIISESGGDYFSELGGEIISESGGGLPRNLHAGRTDLPMLSYGLFAQRIDAHLQRRQVGDVAGDHHRVEAVALGKPVKRK